LSSASDALELVILVQLVQVAMDRDLAYIENSGELTERYLALPLDLV
jgi:hypothetical protein